MGLGLARHRLLRDEPGDRPDRSRDRGEEGREGRWWGSNEFVARSAYRHYEDPPTYGDKHIGFRVASQ
jgi:formylglycine-generating enzyme required for sulfatase activity